MQMPTTRLTPLAAVVLPLLLAGCDAAGLKLRGFGDRSPDAAAPAHSGPPAVSPLEVPIETGQAAAPVGTANRETVGVAAFVAQGADWSAVVDGKAAALTRPGARPVRIPVRRIDFGGGAEFVGALGGQAFALTIRAADCEGGSPLSASVRYTGKTAAGCAAPATAEQVATIAAAAPAPAPKKPAAPKPAPAKPATPAPTTPPAAATPASPTTAPTAPEAAPAVTTTPETAPATTPAAPGAAPVAPGAAPAATPATPAAPEAAPATDATTPPILIPGGPTGLPGAPVLPATPPVADE